MAQRGHQRSHSEHIDGLRRLAKHALRRQCRCELAMALHRAGHRVRLSLLATGLGMLFGSFLNSSRAAGGTALGFVGLFYLMNTLGGLSDKLSWMQKIQPFYYTQAVQALALHSITWWYPWILVIIGLVLGIIGLVVFNRRDLPTV